MHLLLPLDIKLCLMAFIGYVDLFLSLVERVMLLVLLQSQPACHTSTFDQPVTNGTLNETTIAGSANVACFQSLACSLVP